MNPTPVPLISVILPVWNGERYLVEAIESILGQTFADFELLITDDGSTDRTPAILRQFESSDPRVRILWQEHRGMVPSLNLAIAEARGKFLARMDADDVALPERFARQVAYLEANPGCVAVGTAMLVIDPEGAPIYTQEVETDSETLVANLLGLNPKPKSGLAHPTVLMRREAVNAIGGYRKEYESIEDIDLWLRLAERGLLGNVPAVLLKYRLHENSVSHTQNAQQRAYHTRLIREARLKRGLPPPDPRPPRNGSLSSRDLYKAWCRRASESGNRRTALKYAVRVLKHDSARSDWWLVSDALFGVGATNRLKNSYRRIALHEPEPPTHSAPPARATQRREAARELTALLEANRAFSFIRLGDGEVLWLRQLETNAAPPCYRYLDGAGSVEVTRAVVGMEARHEARFRKALQGASYLDRCDSISVVRDYLPKLALQRDPALHTNASPETSNIIFEWVAFEMKSWLERHRCLIAGAEAALLRELYAVPAYREIASEVLPAGGELHFHQLRENGRHYSQNLDLIKEDLRREIERTGCDTLFLSLATGAKVLCYEIAQEMEIRAIDFGSMVRALTYAGSSGYQLCRDMHNPFLFRVPIALFMPALERAHPELGLAELASKSHAQMALEVHRHERFVFNTSDGLRDGAVELSEENLHHFRQSRRYYDRHYRGRVRADATARRLDAEFQRWCLKKGIGVSGKTFLALVRGKRTLRRLRDFFGVDWGDYPATPGRALYLVRQKFEHGLRTVYFRDVVRPEILRAPPLSGTDDPRCEIHVLTSAGDWLNLVWALRTFYYYSGRRYALCIHDDGTLTAETLDRLRAMFPAARIIPRPEADARMAEVLAGSPRSRAFRSTNRLALKVFDFATYLDAPRMLLLDSDILFFRKPEALIAALEDPTFAHNTLNLDWKNGYTIDPAELAGRLGFSCPPRINSGLGLIHRGSIRLDWVEEFLALPGIDGHSHQIEQTLIALCSAKYGFQMLPPEYDVRLDQIAPGAPSRHYTGPIRHLMYREGVQRLLTCGFLTALSAG